MERNPTRHALTVFAVGTLLASSSVASAGPRADTGPLWQVNRVVENVSYGTPAQLEGDFLVRVGQGDPVRMARHFLKVERVRLGLNAPSQELRVMDAIGPDRLGMTHVRFAQQSRGGVPVFGADLWVHLEGNRVTGMNGVYLRSVAVDTQPQLGAELAGQIALDELQDLLNRGEANPWVSDRNVALGLDEEPELMVFNRGLLIDARTPSELAWKVNVNNYIFFISARDGSVLELWDTVASGLSREVYDTKNTTNLPGQLVCSGSSCSTSDADTQDVWQQFGDVYNYFMGTHGRDSWDDGGAALIGSVHYSQNYQNAYWNGSQMVFGDMRGAWDVTAHELGHAVCQETANLTYKYQMGALNESYSDIWGAMVDREDWEIGEDLQGIGTIRDMSDPGAYDQPKDMTEFRYFLFYDNGGVHINSGIPNYFTYLASDGGTNLGVTVVGQGRDIVEEILYRVETTRLNSNSKFADFARAVESSCGELHSNSSPVCEEIGNAIAAVGL